MRWQQRLYDDWFAAGIIPSAIDLPTGLGKTAVMAIWLLARAAGANLPRRLVYVVDRRAVVDQATSVAEQMRQALKKPELAAVAQALGLADGRKLPISTLRGKFADNRDWLQDPTATAIVVGTVDMLGSRLLFEGYGVSRRMRPYQAGLLGVDALFVVDEAHLVPPFERMLEAVATEPRLQPQGELRQRIVPKFKVLPLSATGRARESGTFALVNADVSDAIVAKRLSAIKRLSVVELSDKQDLAAMLVDQAWRIAAERNGPTRCIVYVDKRKVAAAVAAELEKRAKVAPSAPPVRVELFVGERRIHERELAAQWLADNGFLAGTEVVPLQATFLVATSAGEVGVDLDADDMVCDVVTWERMVQRLGRVNRLGKGAATVCVVHEPNPKALVTALAKPEDKRGEQDLAEIARHCRRMAVVDVFTEIAHGAVVDASPGALQTLKHRSDSWAARLRNASTPEPLRPALTLPLVEAWAMTSLAQHTGRPEVRPWLRGWVDDDDPQTTLVWRKWLPVREGADVEELAEFLEAAPPHAAEQLEVAVWRAADWLKKRLDSAQKGRPGAPAELAPGAPWALLIKDDQARVQYLADGAEKQKDALDRLCKFSLAGATLILAANLGGLADGLLDEAENESPPTLDGDGGWQGVDYRVIEQIATSPALPGSGDWTSEGVEFVLAVDAEGNPARSLAVQRRAITAMGHTADSQAIARRAQLLSDHQSWAEACAVRIAGVVGLPGEHAQLLAIAARLHDEGKKADIWQRAFRAPKGGIYAKTRGPIAPAMLHGYRHEFGSLPFAEADAQVCALPEELRDLVLHLIAAHHGWARPVIPTEGATDGPPSAMRGRAQLVALRYARLSQQWGPWGLAWWEALLKAADWQASKDNDDSGLTGRAGVA